MDLLILIVAIQLTKKIRKFNSILGQFKWDMRSQIFHHQLFTNQIFKHVLLVCDYVAYCNAMILASKYYLIRYNIAMTFVQSRISCQNQVMNNERCS